MIEKIKDTTIEEWKQNIYDKINELIDVVNGILLADERVTALDTKQEKCEHLFSLQGEYYVCKKCGGTIKDKSVSICAYCNGERTIVSSCIGTIEHRDICPKCHGTGTMG